MIGSRKILWFLLCSIVVLGLAACAPEDANPNINGGKKKPEHTDTTGHGEQDSPEHSSSIKDVMTQTPSHISRIIDDNFAVEADIHTPQVESADILFAKYTAFDEQKLTSIFYKNKSPQRKVDNIENSTILSENDGSYLNFSDGFVSYITRDFQYVMFPTDSFTRAGDIFSYNKFFGDVYTKENLDFLPVSKAMETVYNVLSELSINAIRDSETYAIDSLTMQEQQTGRINEYIKRQEEMDDPTADDTTVDDATWGYLTKDKFTEDDDFYIFFIKTKQNDIPVTEKSYMIQASERSMNGSTIRASVSKNGIIEFNLTGMYQKEGIAESPEKVISVDGAIQNAYRKFNDVISSEKVMITAIDFEYVPVPYNKNYNEVKLIPAWCLTTAYEVTIDKPTEDGKQETLTHMSYRVIFINAITGEEIE